MSPPRRVPSQRDFESLASWLASPECTHELLRLAVRLGCAGDEEDVLQQFLAEKMAAVIPRLPEDDGEAWRYLRVVFAHYSQDVARANRKRRSVIVAMGTVTDVDIRTEPSTRDDPMGTLDRERMRAVLEDYLELLQDDYRDAVQAVCLKGEAIASFAERRGITPNLARVRVHRGTHELARIARGPSLSNREIHDWAGLMSCLAGADESSTPSAAQAVWRHLPPDVRTLVRDEARTPDVDSHRRNTISSALNVVLMRKELYDERCFAAAFERPKLPAVLRRFFSSADDRFRKRPSQVPWLNRLLFEWAFRDYM